MADHSCLDLQPTGQVPGSSTAENLHPNHHSAAILQFANSVFGLAYMNAILNSTKCSRGFRSLPIFVSSAKVINIPCSTSFVAITPKTRYARDQDAIVLDLITRLGRSPGLYINMKPSSAARGVSLPSDALRRSSPTFVVSRFVS
jgi:hypothetical protein